MVLRLTRYNNLAPNKVLIPFIIIALASVDMDLMLLIRIKKNSNEIYNFLFTLPIPSLFIV